MTTVTVEEAQARLAELLDHLQPGDEVVITRNDQPVAKLVGAGSTAAQPRQPGLLRDQILHMADDFDAPLEGFAPGEGP
jgi:prevent-host-death family protein